MHQITPGSPSCCLPWQRKPQSKAAVLIRETENSQRSLQLAKARLHPVKVQAINIINYLPYLLSYRLPSSTNQLAFWEGRKRGPGVTLAQGMLSSCDSTAPQTPAPFVWRNINKAHKHTSPLPSNATSSLLVCSFLVYSSPD